MTRPARSTLFGIALAVALLATAAGAAAAAPAAGGTSATAGTPADASAANASAAFGQAVYLTTGGDATELTISLNGTDTATVQVGATTKRYVANVTVTDGDDDGTVTLLFDTGVAGVAGTDEATFAVASDADDVTVRDETSLDEPLGVADLPVTASVDGAETDSATILVREESREESGDVTSTATPSPTPTDTVADTTSATATNGSDEGSTDESSPGFGLVAALVALVGAALLARR